MELVNEDLQQRKERVNEMLHELLYLIDIHGILRKPSWDGVRALLLTMPLTEGASTPPRSRRSPLLIYHLIIADVLTPMERLVSG